VGLIREAATWAKAADVSRFSDDDAAPPTRVVEVSNGPVERILRSFMAALNREKKLDEDQKVERHPSARGEL
jgi:hypothetical protein